MPPMEASAPGSIGKNRPVLLISSLSCLRVTPGCTVTVRSSALIDSTRFMRDTSMLMPPCTASRWPSSDEPTPKGITGTLCSLASFTASATSCVLSAKTTADGRWRIEGRFVAPVLRAHRQRGRAAVAEARLERVDQRIGHLAQCESRA